MSRCLDGSQMVRFMNTVGGDDCAQEVWSGEPGNHGTHPTTEDSRYSQASRSIHFLLYQNKYDVTKFLNRASQQIRRSGSWLSSRNARLRGKNEEHLHWNDREHIRLTPAPKNQCEWGSTNEYPRAERFTCNHGRKF